MSIGVAVIGAGMAGKSHAAAYRVAPTLYESTLPDLRYVAIGDINADLGEVTAKRYGFGRAVTDWREIAADPSINVVSVALFAFKGLWLTVLLVVVARVGWVGVITLRAVVWRRNFPDAARARLASRLSALNALLMASSGALLGWMLGHAPAAIPYFFAVVAAVGLLGAWRYRRLRLRGHGGLRERERLARADRDLKPSLASFKRVLADDPVYRQYMQSMFVFGSGNLMLPAPLLIVLGERLALSPFAQVLLVGTLPLVTLPFAIVLWARYYDRVHIIQFRSVHAWSFVSASVAFLIGCATGQMAWLVIGSILLGIGFAGGQLGWNLGHNDFSRPEQAALYMGVHVTLTGMRGLAAPLVGVALYRGVDAIWPGFGYTSLLVPVVLNVVGAFSFLRLRRRFLEAG